MTRYIYTNPETNGDFLDLVHQLMRWGVVTKRRIYFLFFFNDTATTEIYTLSLHDALPIRNWLRSLRASSAPMAHFGTASTSTSHSWPCVATACPRPSARSAPGSGRSPPISGRRRSTTTPSHGLGGIGRTPRQRRPRPRRVRPVRPTPPCSAGQSDAPPPMRMRRTPHDRRPLLPKT